MLHNFNNGIYPMQNIEIMPKRLSGSEKPHLQIEGKVFLQMHLPLHSQREEGEGDNYTWVDLCANHNYEGM